MIQAKKRAWKDDSLLVKDVTSQAKAGQSSLSKRIILLWLLGTVVLLPMNIINLPLNMAMVDYWIVLGLPLLWLFIIRGPQPLSLSYTVVMWIILVSSLASTFAAVKPSNSLIVIVKEVYVFLWFITLTAVISKLNARDFHRLMIVWTGVVLLHGVLMIAQFISPNLWQTISRLAGKPTSFVFYRPSGLFLCDTAGCANRAAYFQLLGFVPLMLAGLSKRKTIIFGIVLFASILATGSMGATLAFMVGLASAVVATAVIRKQLSIIINNVIRLMIAVTLFGGLFYALVNLNQRIQDHFERIIVGRADRSSGGRFGLWERGAEVLLDGQLGLWGIGPENFRVVDWQGKQLHNDVIAFLVERGLLGTLGLVGIAVIALTKALNLLLIHRKSPERAQLVEVVFLAAVMATLVESLTHQIFHDRQLWLVLALLEAMLYKSMVSASSSELNRPSLSQNRLHPRGLTRRNDVSGGRLHAD